MAGQFVGQEFLCRSISGDFLVGQKGDDAFLEGAKAALDFAFGLRARGDQMGDAQGGLFMLDQEMSQRLFMIPPGVTLIAGAARA